MGSAAVARSGFGLLRQLANSDAIKNAIVDKDGLELINTAVGAHIACAGKHPPRQKTNKVQLTCRCPLNM